MTQYTGKQINVPGGHIHAIENMLGVSGYEIGARASNKLLRIPAHLRLWPGDPERFVQVQAHKRHYPDVWGEFDNEVGARASNKLLKIPAHLRLWPGDPERFVQVQAYKRHYPDVWGEDVSEVGRLEIGAMSQAFDINPPRMVGKIRTFVKGKNLVAMVRVKVPATNGSMLVAIKLPLSTIKKISPSVEPTMLSGEFDSYSSGNDIGFSLNPVKSFVKKALHKTVSNPAFKLVAKHSVIASKYIGKKAKKVAQNPYVQKFSQQAAVAVATSYGVPPQVTMASTNVLFDAMNGDKVSLDKIANIAALASDGDKTAKKLKGVMSLLYKGGMSKMKPYLIQAQKAAQNQFAKTSKQFRLEVAKTLPLFSLPGKPPGLFPFEALRSDYGASISGWLYNIPYRTNVQAKEFDLFGKGRNPLHLLRAAYTNGMQ